MHKDHLRLLTNLRHFHTEGVTFKSLCLHPKRKRSILGIGLILGFCILLLEITAFSPQACTLLGLAMGAFARDIQNMLLFRKHWPTWDSIIDWHRVDTKIEAKEVSADRSHLE
jgi:hypothetical protein